MTKSNNPLQQFFRQPAVYVRLPSGGNFWSDGSLIPSKTNEFPVYPMTAIDEITYRTPDGLFNGQAVVSVIQSCLPNVLDAWDMPTMDVNAVLIAIRIASFGHELALTTTCPACNNEDDVGIDLRTILDQMHTPDYTVQIKQGDVEITIRPISYREQTKINISQYENQRRLNLNNESDLSDEQKIKNITDIMKQITDLTIELLKCSIVSIRVPGTLVTESQFIDEYLHNCDRGMFTKIRDTVIGLRESAEIKPMKWKCTGCGHEYDQPISLDQSNFFGNAS